MQTTRSDRRRFLSQIAGVVALTASTARAWAATPGEWEQTVAAAKKEGKVAINTFTGQAYGRILKLFARAYPEIKVDHSSLEPVDFSPRIINERDRKSTRLNSSHLGISYAVFCLKKKT